MIIEYNGKRYETTTNDRGQVISKVGKVFLGRSVDNLIPGAVKVEDEVPADQK